PYVIYLIYTTACNFCLYMVARLQFSALCIAHGGGPPRCAQTHTHTHTDTCAHTQVSTLPPATELGLRISAQLRTLKLYKTHFQALMNPAIFSYRTGLRMATTDVETERTYRMSAPKIQK